MSDSLSQTFLAITRNTTDLEWLQGALAPLGQVVSAGTGSLDELLALVDVTFALPPGSFTWLLGPSGQRRHRPCSVRRRSQEVGVWPSGTSSRGYW